MLIGVDVGGTFTDVVAASDDDITTVKVATDTETERGVLAGAREIGVEQASSFNHASTHGLNAIITRRLPKIGFLSTIGHRDILDAGNVWRPAEALTDPHWRRSYGDAANPLVPRYLRRGVRERLTANGSALIPLDEEQLRAELAVFRECEVAGVAVCLLHAYAHPQHEVRVRELVKQELGDVPCSISSEVSPLAKEYERASTTVIDAFMKLIYGEYTDRLVSGLHELGFSGELNFANCAAQLLSADVAMDHPFNIVFSGPAAGTMACARFGEMVEARNLLCADVGGTSCDLSVVADGHPYLNTTFELEHDLIVNALSNEVSSIGAGGGSLVTISSVGELQVGPGSAGADPGPACYGKGGTEPTMTDACLLMGIIDPDGFASGRMRLDRELSKQAFERLDCTLSFAQRVNYAFNLGVNHIAEGVVNVSVKNGIDPRDYSLVAYGAAGPMLAPSILDLVHAKEVIVPPHPGLFSALGLLSSDQVYADSQATYAVLSADTAGVVGKIYEQMETRLKERLKPATEQFEIARTFDGRLLGQNFETPFVQVPSGELTPDAVDQMIKNFHDVYEERLGNRFDSLPVEGVTYRVQARVTAEKVQYPTLEERKAGQPLTPHRYAAIHYLTDDETVDSAEYQRTDLRAGDVVPGPAIIREPMSTTFVPPSKQARVGQYGELRISA